MSEPWPPGPAPHPAETIPAAGGAPTPADPVAVAGPAAPPLPADGSEQHLDPRHVPLQRLVGGILAAGLAFSLFIGAIVLSASLRSLPVFALSVVVWFVASAGFAWFCWAWPPVEHRHTSYRLTGTGIEIRRGVVWREVVTVPRSRLQHTDVSQGPLERSFELATLHLFTAGTDYAKVSLGGLAHVTAVALRDHLVGGGGDDAV